MDKKKIKLIVLLSVFVVAMIGFSFLGRTKQVDLTSEMPQATLPVVCLQKGNTYINQLFGHRGEMNSSSIRDTITPLGENMTVPVTIQAFENHVESISYEVRTLDMSRLLEEKEISDYSQKDGMISTKIQLQNLLEEDTEYHLIITLQCEGEEIRYYTRVIRAQNYFVDKAINFVTDFHEKTFDSEKYRELATYLEPGTASDNTTLQKVTIHSSLNQIAWGDFHGEIINTPIPSVKEINSSYTAVTLNYIMTANGENGELEYYNVEEYYRVRYSEGSQRMYLLDFERTMHEIFRGSGDNFSETAILLGIREDNVSYITNENATIVSFIQEGDLWSYNRNTNQLTLIFSFRGIEGVNDRENNPNHDIRIIRVDESGSMDFVVYGYMNRGQHEGYTGIGVYRYDSIANTIREELFVQSKESYQVLKESWGDLFYTSGDGYFYIIAEENLYKINLSDGKAQIMNTGLNEENSAVSKDGRYIAWREKVAQHRIVVMDLEEESKQEFAGEEGQCLRPIGFIESDFVYGIGLESQSQLLQKIVIVDKDQQVVKEYEKPGQYISDAYVDDSTVFLDRVKKTGAYYGEVESDAIKSHEIEAAQGIRPKTYTTTRKQSQVSLGLEQEFITKIPQMVIPKEVVVEKKNVVVLDTVPETGRYDVYVGGKVILDTLDIAEAIQQADKVAGVVIGDNQKFIWSRAKRSSISLGNKILLSLEEIPDGKVIDLTGCSLSQVLYFVAQGSPVFTQGENQEELIIIGYDEINVTLYNPVTDDTYKKKIEDSEEMFRSVGNIFISYLKE